MIRKPRNYVPHLRAEWHRQHPDRPSHDHKEFNDEILVAVAFIMRQIDPTGIKPVIEPPVYLEGAEPGPSAKGSGRRKRARE